MGKIYLLTGDNYLVDRRMKEIVKNVGVDEFNTVTYDIEEDDFNNAITDSATIPFMSDHKVVIVKNTDFKERDGFIIDDLITLLDDIPSFLHLIIIPNKQLDKRSKLVKLLIGKADVTHFQALEEKTMKTSIVNYFDKRNIRIHNDALNELVRRTENDTQRMMNELQKLENYFNEGDSIFIDDISSLVVRNVEHDVFALVNEVVNRDLDKVMQICYDLLRSEDALRLLGLIINKFREMNYAKTLLTKGYSDEDLMKFFRASKGRIYYVKKNAARVTEEYIEKQLSALADTELKIKKGLLDKKVGLEMYLLNI